MKKTTGWLIGGSALLAVAACSPYPYPVPQYAVPAPPPLQPYYGPVVPVVQAPPTRVVKRRYVRKRYHRPRCRCTPTQ